MKRKIRLTILLLLMAIGWVMGQSQFSPEAYRQYLQQTENLTFQALQQQKSLPTPLYSKLDVATHPKEHAYLDSIIQIYGLTADELALLEKNHFVVSERLNFDCFGRALHDIYINDLPVFITTDAVLHALHVSYDKLLMDLESALLEPNLIEVCNRLVQAYPVLLKKYEQVPALHSNLGDVDLFVTIARSLILGELFHPAGPYCSDTDLRTLWNAIESEQMTQMPLFSERNRRLDFSQFTVRGHYTQEVPYPGSGKTLAEYFRCMMWLGRIDFLLTPPPDNPWEQPWSRDEIRRMNISALLLHELLGLADASELLSENDRIITFMVGESDNLTPGEFSDILDSLQLADAAMLYQEDQFDRLQNALSNSSDAGQRILSNFFLMDPFASEPDPLPVSYRLAGQRFIIDSYIFSNVVYDRIIYQGQKIWRPMPDPLDAMFVLGNNAALPLLQKELERYSYAGQLAALRYLTDAYDESFWQSSLYNVWLQALRALNPPADLSLHPMFMQTTAWQQQKLNTQLASWAQLRHDNLLYGKQSYTGGTGCSYPHSFVEPIPQFFQQIAGFAEIAGNYFLTIPNLDYQIEGIQDYFNRLNTVSTQLAVIAQKQLDRQPLSPEEKDWLKRMLFVEGGSGTPPFSGWYADLYYDPLKAAEGDYVIADVHTQPTDETGAVVGRVLHVGVGKLNLGVVLADVNGTPTAFVGPMMSYYEQITDNFKRLTDEEWSSLVESGQTPARPDWVNAYLTNTKGGEFEAGRIIPGIVQSQVPAGKASIPESFELHSYPNPFNPQTTIEYTVSKPQSIQMAIYDGVGRQVEVLLDRHHLPGRYRLNWSADDCASGIYYCLIKNGETQKSIKLLLIK
ncbi:MAG TPA: DUF3160 domain-containing protein [bacterium]|nr:DUF3160 domain-containing protein [bacterium]